jgi:hypothetical protein
MASRRTTNGLFLVPANADRNWDVTLGRDYDVLDALAAVGQLSAYATLVDGSGNPTSLSLTVSPGTFLTAAGVPASYAGGSATLAASSTVYVWLTEAAALATGSAWPATNYVPVAVVTTGAAAIAAVADARAPWRAVPFPLAGANQAALVNSTGATPGTTLSAVTDTTATDQSGAINANFAALWNLTDAVRSALVTRRVIKGSA